MAFKIALSAGHYKYTAGRRCLKKYDKNETREWVLNDRICDKIEKKLKDYEGYELLRVDDTTGEKLVELDERTNKANKWGANVYLSIHHDAGINGGSGGGVTAFVHPSAGAEAKAWQKELYNAIIANTGLKGNRATPIRTDDFHEVREPKAPAVLMECGFMDSSADVPIIITDKYAEGVANAYVSVIVKRGGLTKKKATTTTTTTTPTTDKIYRVQVGAFKSKTNAEAYVKKLKAAGFDAFIV